MRRDSGAGMIRLLLAAALALSPAPALAQQPAALSLDHRMLLRCSAAFALVANRQAEGDEAALAFPAMAGQGRAFFVRAAAQVMDEAGLDRAAITAALEAEARELAGGDTLALVMPACLALLPPAAQ